MKEHRNSLFAFVHSFYCLFALLMSVNSSTMPVGIDAIDYLSKKTDVLTLVSFRC